MAVSLESGWLTLAEAAARLGCHVETLRLRFRRGGLEFRRGPHNRYYVTEEELTYLRPIRRMKRRPLEPEREDLLRQSLDRLLVDRTGLMGWQRAMLEAIRDHPAADRPLHRALAVRALGEAGFNLRETALQLDISERQVRRLRSMTLTGALLAAYERGKRKERGALRRLARPVVAEIQARLAASGFRPARRDPRSGKSGARDGQTARMLLVRNLSRDQIQDLRMAGLTQQQIHAISLVGIGVDELNELMLNGLPAPDSTNPK
jgi:DNA-binding transcriptional MerR regulator